MCARMYARTYNCHDTTGHTTSTHDNDQHTNGTQDTSGKGRREKPAYIGIIAGTEKKHKKVKKNLEI